MEKKILVIDDDKSIAWVMEKALEPLGFEVQSRATVKSGLKVSDSFRLILLDLMLPDGNGLDALKEIRIFNPEALVIIVTAQGRMSVAIEAMKEGAYDYLEKPFDIDELKIVVERAFSELLMRQELMALRQAKEECMPYEMIAKSKNMLKIFKEIGRVAAKDVTVLVSGESGTGKELVARAVHNNSRRKIGPFIAVNAASIPKDLLEAELFGWEKGAFTGAVGRGEGKISAAEGGTLFLDEISELDINLQAKLLRFMQDMEYSRIGSSKTIKANVRIIGATNCDLMESIASGRFREDLYYRFNVVELRVPPLRDRRDDILLLARHFLAAAVEDFELGPKEFAKDAEKFLLQYEWPGNVRELENMVKRVSILSRNIRIDRKDLAAGDHTACSIGDFIEGKLCSIMKKLSKVENSDLYRTVISEVEKSLVAIVLRETKGNQLKASRMLGINRNTLARMIRQYKIV
ncbi:MAG: sigma-54 dependent transcriptional regulator [Dissulfurispiraceae bacterium]|jgi:two-component system nitrogen regulation response regulator GlnG|nr:sigma-54 dependent transcriptional regulator [Dissulfurispiraceae bacterium]